MGKRQAIQHTYGIEDDEVEVVDDPSLVRAAKEIVGDTDKSQTVLSGKKRQSKKGQKASRKR